MAVDLTNVGSLTFQEDNVAGTGSEILFAPREYFDTIQKTKTPLDATSIEEITEISTAHVFATGKGFHKLYVEPKSSSCNSEIVGGDGAPALKWTFQGHTAGKNFNLLGNLRMAKNMRGILLVPYREGDGQYIQIGTADSPAELRGSFVLGDVEGGQRGVNWEGMGYSEGVNIYTAAVELYPTGP